MSEHIDNLEYDQLLDEFKELLKLNSLKFTKQREAVLRVLYNNEGHFTPEDVYTLVKELYADLNVGIATVYRTINLLEESDIITSLSFGAQGKKYEIATKPHHDHMICKKCAKIIEFEDEGIEKRQRTIAKKYNFKLTSHLLQLYGVCEECNKNKKGKK